MSTTFSLFNFSLPNNANSLFKWDKSNSALCITSLLFSIKPKNSSTISANFLWVDNSKRTQHTALIDCDLLAKVYINLLDQKEPTLNFKNEDNEKIIINSNDTNQYYKKVIKPTEEELKLHKEYLKSSLKKNFFN